MDVAEICEKHFKLLLKHKGNKIATNLMRQHFSNYIKGFPGASKFRQKLVTASNLIEMKDELSSFKSFANNF